MLHIRDTGTRDVLWIAGIWIVLGTLVELGTNYALSNWYPQMISYQGHVTADAFAFLLRIDVVTVTLVIIVFVYSIIRFRAPARDLTPSSAQYRFGRLFAWGWLTVSAVLNILFIIYPGVTGLETIWNYAAGVKHPLIVDVTAEQWDWSFDYPEYHIQGQTTLVLPVNTPIEFVLKSKDVIHSFWVPAFVIKEAVIPGETRTLYITVDKITSTKVDPLARVQCSQICGVGPSEMRAELRILSTADFQKWVAQQQRSSGGGS